jgi:hypothetical protein
MTVTASMAPAYPLPGKPVEVTCTCSVGNWVRVALTSGPEASTYQKQIYDNNLSELQLWVADAGEPHRFTFDVPGVYTCTAREYTKGGVGFGGDYAGDPAGYASETAIGSNTVTFTVGQRMSADIRYRAERGSLVLYVWNSTIRATTVPEHGERSPRFDGSTPLMKTAASTTPVTSALNALDGVACSVAAGSMGTALDNVMTKFNSHITATGTGAIHANPDTSNSVAASYFGATTPDAMRDTVQRFGAVMRQHFTNDAGTGSGVGSGSYHAVADWDNLPLLSGVSDVLSASLALASLWHSYEAHRVDTTVHGAADNTNTSSALPPLYAAYAAILGVLHSDNPTAPAVDNPGATLLVHRAGLAKT